MEDAQKPISLTLIFIFGVATDSKGPAQEMDGWSCSPYCTSTTEGSAASLRARYVCSFLV